MIKEDFLNFIHELPDPEDSNTHKYKNKIFDIIWDFLEEQKRDQLNIIIKAILRWDNRDVASHIDVGLANAINDALPILDPEAVYGPVELVRKQCFELREENLRLQDEINKVQDSVIKYIKQRDDIHLELSNLKAGLPKFQPGDKCWVLCHDAIRQATVKSMVESGNFILHITDMSEFEVSKYEIFNSAEECRANIPIFDES